MFKVSTRQASIRAVRRIIRTRASRPTISDEIHKSQRALNGVARYRTRTFDSIRDGEADHRHHPAARHQGDYISVIRRREENRRRHDRDRTLELAPRCRLTAVDSVHIVPGGGGANLCSLEHLRGHAGRGHHRVQVGENWLPAWSPTAQAGLQHHARRATREINREPRGSQNETPDQQPPESIAITRPGQTVRKTQIAFTPTGAATPQIYTSSTADGLNRSKERNVGVVLRPPDVVAGAHPRPRLRRAQRSGFDIRGLRLSTGAPKVVTFGEGTNESPALRPTVANIVFTSTRRGRTQVFTMARDGEGRPMTKAGNKLRKDVQMRDRRWTAAARPIDSDIDGGERTLVPPRPLRQEENTPVAD